MDDPAGNNYLQNLYAPDEDPQLTIEEYERTHEQNEELGLNDMKTENYGEETRVIPQQKASWSFLQVIWRRRKQSEN